MIDERERERRQDVGSNRTLEPFVGKGGARIAPWCDTWTEWDERVKHPRGKRQHRKGKPALKQLIK